LKRAERVTALARGAVQGVGFRYFVLTRARSRGLTGYVRNEADGSVSVVAEGAKEDLEDLVAELRAGPGRGLVTDLSVDWREATGEFRDFDVRF
jgi:acylphosphatase